MANGRTPRFDTVVVRALSVSTSDPHQLWQPLRVGPVSERIAQRILGLIANQELRPGDRLPSERELAELLGVSRPSLREAIKSLQAHGRVQVRHGAGVFVTEPHSAHELQTALLAQEMSLAELFAMREVLELPAAEWAAERQEPRRLASMQAAFDSLLAASLAADVDWGALMTLDAAYHLRIVEAAGNRFLSQTVGVLHAMLAQSMQTTLMLPGRLERSRTEHREILDAILAGDAARARGAVLTHLTGARDAALARVETDRRAAQNG